MKSACLKRVKDPALVPVANMEPLTAGAGEIEKLACADHAIATIRQDSICTEVCPRTGYLKFQCLGKYGAEFMRGVVLSEKICYIQPLNPRQNASRPVKDVDGSTLIHSPLR
jgi:hypothetical protein